MTFPVLFLIACAVMVLPFGLMLGLLAMWRAFLRRLEKQMEEHDRIAKRWR